DVSGAIGGGQVGCDYQIGTNWVVGVEFDYSFANLRGDQIDPFFDNKTLHARMRGLAALAGKLGYAFDRTMVYVKGGGAWARDEYSVTSPQAFDGITLVAAPDARASETRAGWTLGFGFERAIWDDWSVKLEYDHYDFGTRRVTLVDPVFGLQPADIRQRVDAVTVGINYRFGRPVSARY